MRIISLCIINPHRIRYQTFTNLNKDKRFFIQLSIGNIRFRKFHSTSTGRGIGITTRHLQHLWGLIGGRVIGEKSMEAPARVFKKD